jgi:uncharacterized protein (TIGR02271 family)
MTQVLVGVFDSFADANQAIAALTEDGIAREDMELHSSERKGETLAERTDTGLPVQHAPEGAETGIGGFFRRLFGNDEQPAEVGHYQEAVRRGGAILTVTVVDEAQEANVRAALEGAGAIDVDERVAQWQSTGYTAYDPASPSYSPAEIDAERKSFPVVRESLEVGKREVQTGGVRVYSRATETPVSEAVSLREEHATIERRPVDRVATAADLATGSVEVRETAEHPVVAKTAHVVEEVVVGREATERTETINETLHGTEVEVERLEGAPIANGGISATAADAGTPPVKSDPQRP